MRIVLLPIPEGDVIAREQQFGCFEAEFVEFPDGRVFYRHPWDARLWFAGSTVAAFRAAAGAWNRYCDEGHGRRTDVEGTEAAARLREALSRLSMLEDGPDNLWAVLLEQAETGLL